MEYYIKVYNINMFREPVILANTIGKTTVQILGENNFQNRFLIKYMLPEMSDYSYHVYTLGMIIEEFLVSEQEIKFKLYLWYFIFCISILII